MTIVKTRGIGHTIDLGEIDCIDFHRSIGESVAIGSLVSEMHVIDKRIVLGVGNHTILIGVGRELHRIAHCRIGRIVVGTRGRT